MKRNTKFSKIQEISLREMNIKVNRKVGNTKKNKINKKGRNNQMIVTQINQSSQKMKNCFTKKQKISQRREILFSIHLRK
jgi:hypothetical protein